MPNAVVINPAACPPLSILRMLPVEGLTTTENDLLELRAVVYADQKRLRSKEATMATIGFEMQYSTTLIHQHYGNNRLTHADMLHSLVCCAVSQYYRVANKPHDPESLKQTVMQIYETLNEQ